MNAPVFDLQRIHSGGLALGHARIDSDHLELAQLFNAVVDAIGRDAGFDETAEAIERLVSFAALHFEREEQWMRDAGYPAADEHGTAHVELLWSAEAIRDLQLAPARCGELLWMLHDWVHRHIDTADRAFVDFINARTAPR